MSLLYPNRGKSKTSVAIGRQPEGEIVLEFSADCGKFGTDEILDRYTLTAERLLEILQSHDLDDYKESELL